MERKYLENLKKSMKAEIVLKNILKIQKKIEDLTSKLDGEMNQIYFMVGDLYYQINERPNKKKSKAKKKLK
jgi:hypothetical protein